MNDLRYAIPGAIFFSIFGILLFMHGGSWEKCLVLWVFLMGGISQFLAQDPSFGARVTAVFMAWFAILLAIAAMITYTLG